MYTDGYWFAEFRFQLFATTIVSFGRLVIRIEGFWIIERVPSEIGYVVLGAEL